MQGRLEIDSNYFAKAEKKLESLPDYVTDWYHYMQASYMTAKTCRDYVFKVAMFLSYIDINPKRVKPEQITESVVTSYMFSKSTKTKDGKETETSDSHKNSVWYALRSFLQYLTDHGMIEKNYITGIKRKKNKDLERINKDRILLTIDDFNKILSYINEEHSRYPERDKAIILLYMSTGMRKAALASINMDDVDLENKKLTIIDKGDITHEYILNTAEINAINSWLEKRTEFRGSDDSSALFISNLGNRLSESELERMIKHYTSKTLSLPVSPHKLRSGFISIMYNETGDIEKVRRIVGHKNVSTTQRYIVTDGKEKEEAADIMEKLLI